MPSHFPAVWHPVFDCIEAYAPGFKGSVVGRDVLTPPDLERIFGLPGGVSISPGSLLLSAPPPWRSLHTWPSSEEREVAETTAERRQRSDQIWGVGEELGDIDRGGCVARTVALLGGCPC